MPDQKVNINIAQQHRYTFLMNMLESDYIVCVRGSGNYSIRLYETLCCGRIPVFVNTDCVLPYEFKLKWKDYCVWIEESEISSISEKIIEFHDQLSSKDFVDLQYECRRIWKQWLSP